MQQISFVDTPRARLALKFAAVALATATLAGLTLAVGIAHATEAQEVESQYTKAYRECPGFKNAVDPEMLDCISAEFDVQDKKLNAAYARALAALPARRKVSLRTAQRTWITYRDQWCGISYDNESGSLERIAASQCGLRETVQQALRLEELATSAEADR